MEKTKEQLEREKLELEIAHLVKEGKAYKWKLIFGFLPSVAILVGVLVGINEFLLKDREAENSRRELTFNYLIKRSDPSITAAVDSLDKASTYVYIFFDSLDSSNSAFLKTDHERANELYVRMRKFSEDVIPLSDYYQGLLVGIESNYFDQDMIYLYLTEDASRLVNYFEFMNKRLLRAEDYKLFDLTIFQKVKQFSDLGNTYMEKKKPRASYFKDVGDRMPFAIYVLAFFALLFGIGYIYRKNFRQKVE